MVVAAIAVGLLGAMGAVVFRLLIRTVQALFWGGPDGLELLLEEGLLAEANDPLNQAMGLPWYWRIAIPAAGGLIVGPLIYIFAREAKGHGIPEVMKAVALRGGVIRPRVAAIKSLASAISIGSGGAVGREGPIVQIGSAIGSTIGQWLRLPTIAVRTLVGCGAAAGISATFNAPIAGALFAAEIIIGDFAVTQFMPIVISSVVATVVSRFFLGNHPAFGVPDYEIVSPFELLPYMVTGLVAGVVGVAFIRTLNFSEDAFERFEFPEWGKAAIGGALVGCIGVLLPQVFGVGYETITHALEGTLPVLMLGALVLAKILATSITIGSGGSGGIFAPSLFMGAMTGGFLGTYIHQWFPEATATSGAYALVTMGAVVAATTHAPISAIIIIFELTQKIEIVPALMAACVLSTLVSQLLNKASIYHSKLVRQGVDLHEYQDPNVLKGIFVRDIVDREPEVVPAYANFQTVLDLVVRSPHTQFYVVDETEGKLLGAIALSEIRRLIYEQEALRHLVVAGDLVERHPVVTEEDDLDVAMNLFSSGLFDELAVVDASDRTKLVGTLREKDVIEARNREWIRRDLVGGMSTGVAAVSRGQPVDLGGGYLLEEVTAPSALLGRNLADLRVRTRTGAHVLLLRSAGRESQVVVPTADTEMKEGDTVLVAGSREAIQRFQNLR